MDNIKERLTNRYSLTDQAYERLGAIMVEVQGSKGAMLVKEGEYHPAVYLIKSGAMRSFYLNKAGQEVTYWFGFEGDIAASLGNFIEAKASRENMEFLEDSVLLKMDRNALIALYEKDLELANFGRKVAEQALLEMEEQILLTQFTDAQSRYLKLTKKFPHILQRVKLGHIASYLGITQVTLSRIRAEL